jgi:tetratricopeptide (TPR) repeat protein
MPNLTTTTTKFLIALLKHQAELLLGKDTLGIAAQTVISEEAQKRIDDWLKSDETAGKIWKAAQQAQIYLQDSKNCPDADLRKLFGDVGVGDLPSVQAALIDLPQAMDSGKVKEALYHALDFLKLDAKKQEESAQIYTYALLNAVGSLEMFTLPIIRSVVIDNAKKLDALGIGQAEIKALLEKIVVGKPSIETKTKSGDLPGGSYIPFGRNALFTARAAELEMLAQALLAEREGVVINQQALIGMGGIGKTQLAVEFAWAQGFRFKGVHWISAYKPGGSDLSVDDHIDLAIALCGSKMNLQPWSSDTKQQAEITLNAWKESGPRLIILDNLEDMSAAPAILARLRHSNIRILITTRQSGWHPALALREIPLPAFSEAESLVFLRRVLDADRASDDDLKNLHKRLGGLPLPLDLAAAYLKHVRGMSARAYLDQLNLDHPSLKNWREKHPNATQHDKDVTATFAFSWEQVDDPNAKRLFVLAGYDLPNEPLREDVLQSAVEMESAPFSEAVDLLQSLSLIQQEHSLHPLLAEFARLQDADRSALFAWARTMAWRCYPWLDHGGIYRDPNLARHARLSLAIFDLAIRLPDQDQKALSSLCFHTAFLLTHFGDLDGAMKLYQQSLEIKEGLGDLQGKSATLHQMAGIYVTRGDLDGAMKLYQQSLEIKEGLGDLQGKSATLHQMAGIYVTRGDLDGAMKLYQQSLEIKEGLGDLQGKSATLHQMAGIYVTRGDLDGAMKLYQQSLEIFDGLGDLQGKSATLVNMGVVLFKYNRHAESLSAIMSGLQILIQLGAKLDIEKVISLLRQFQQAVGEPAFLHLWKQVAGKDELPEWLTQTLQEQQGTTIEQFIEIAIRAYQEKHPQAGEIFKAAQRMAADPNAPAEVQALGKALQKIMLGDRNVDLTALPEAWRELIKRTLER